MRDRLPDTPNYRVYSNPSSSATTSNGVTTIAHDDTVTPTDTQDSYYDGWNAVRYYIESEEDIEIAGAKMQELTAEQQLFATDYQWLQNQLASVTDEYEQRFMAGFGVMSGGQE